MRGKDTPNWIELYSALGAVMSAFEQAGLCAPVALVIESERELQAFKHIFNRDLFPPPMQKVDGGVWFGNFEVRVMKS